MGRGRSHSGTGRGRSDLRPPLLFFGHTGSQPHRLKPKQRHRPPGHHGGVSSGRIGRGVTYETPPLQKIRRGAGGWPRWGVVSHQRGRP
ncbi:MAG: hypothetical protein A4E35_01051 [Methanoregula sp. PtaU1.Bin051]|nr:MAG: hypothetical protein A4E35_01051 [Methanoregula sp. PtaU1.Bin051]